MTITLLKAILEATDWNKQLTEWEKTKIPYSDAKKRVVKRIFEKYKNLIKE
jgi:hypothetical protein